MPGVESNSLNELASSSFSDQPRKISGSPLSVGRAQYASGLLSCPACRGSSNAVRRFEYRSSSWYSSTDDGFLVVALLDIFMEISAPSGRGPTTRSVRLESGECFVHRSTRCV